MLENLNFLRNAIPAERDMTTVATITITAKVSDLEKDPYESLRHVAPGIALNQCAENPFIGNNEPSIWTLEG